MGVIRALSQACDVRPLFILQSDAHAFSSWWRSASIFTFNNVQMPLHSILRQLCSQFQPCPRSDFILILSTQVPSWSRYTFGNTPNQPQKFKPFMCFNLQLVFISWRETGCLCPIWRAFGEFSSPHLLDPMVVDIYLVLWKPCIPMLFYAIPLQRFPIACELLHGPRLLLLIKS